MKTYFKNILAVAGLMAALVIPAQAQFDFYAVPRVLDLAWPTVITASGSNFFADTHGFEGLAAVHVYMQTNGATSAASFQLWSGSDMTNWTLVANYSLATSNNVVYTNGATITNGVFVGGSTLSTNTEFLPGTKTIPSAASSGFTTTYLSPAPFTNTFPYTLTANSGGQHVVIGLPIDAQNRYLRFGVNMTGTGSNYVSASLIARRSAQ